MGPIFKLQPHRTMHLQGFDDYGAAFALWGASDTGFNDDRGGLQVKGKLGQENVPSDPGFHPDAFSPRRLFAPFRH